MCSPLESVQWGRKALQLIEQIKKMDTNKTVILHLRHTERHEVKPTMDAALSTEKGKKAAFDFGERLPTNWKYHIWHTISPRTKETCKEIASGLRSNQSEGNIMGEVPVTTIHNFELFQKIQSQNQIVEDTCESSKTFFYDWIQGKYPKNVLTSSLSFSQSIADYMQKNIVDNAVNILVSHDTWIAVLMHHWTGLVPDGWINFLDGFMVQLFEKDMRLSLPNETHLLEYPDWWTSSQ